jgi:cytochrome c peroxidase
VAVAVLSTEGARGDGGRAPANRLPNLAPFPNASGVAETFNTRGAIDLANPFFQDLGTNGRSCGSCHQPADGWTITPAHLRQRFQTSDGRDPVFRPFDGAGCPTQDVSTPKAQRQAYTLLLSKGLIRVPLKPPADAEFAVVAVDNPYGCSSHDEISVYRRPLPSTNLRFLSTLMWDGRESRTNANGNPRPLAKDLVKQAANATAGHAQGLKPLTAGQKEQITDFELALFTAQTFDNKAGPLDAAGARGGPVALSRQKFFLGINDPLGGNPTGAKFTPEVFSLFGPWEVAGQGQNTARLAVARGERVFDSKPIRITGVAGLNDKTGEPVINGFCGTCHDTPNVGNHSLTAPLDLGLATAERRTADLPLIALHNKATGETVRTSDPGRALITGKWADIGKFKGPILRALAARAPYFHNGSAATLLDTVKFYDQRFKIGLSEREKADLVAFLGTL